MKNPIIMLIVAISTALSGCTFYGSPNGDEIQVTASGIPAKIIANNLGANKTVITGSSQASGTFVKENPGIVVIEDDGEIVENSTTIIREELVPIDTKTKVIQVPSGSTGSSYYQKSERLKLKKKPNGKTKIQYEGSTAAGSGNYYYYKNDVPVSRHR
ncbi:MAG TPA: hypothetical protein PKC14_04575 [Candidatus Absconditabacterales bacterium]|nr:hypothetical protein [Candidatus Absconditabacterales bacterium]